MSAAVTCASLHCGRNKPPQRIFRFFFCCCCCCAVRDENSHVPKEEYRRRLKKRQSAEESLTMKITQKRSTSTISSKRERIRKQKTGIACLHLLLYWFIIIHFYYERKMWCFLCQKITIAMYLKMKDESIFIWVLGRHLCLNLYYIHL